MSEWKGECPILTLSSALQKIQIERESMICTRPELRTNWGEMFRKHRCVGEFNSENEMNESVEKEKGIYIVLISGVNHLSSEFIALE